MLTLILIKILIWLSDTQIKCSIIVFNGHAYCDQAYIQKIFKWGAGGGGGGRGKEIEMIKFGEKCMLNMYMYTPKKYSKQN